TSKGLSQYSQSSEAPDVDPSRTASHPSRRELRYGRQTTELLVDSSNRFRRHRSSESLDSQIAEVRLQPCRVERRFERRHMLEDDLPRGRYVQQVSQRCIPQL